MYVDKCKELVERLQPAYRTPTGIPYNVVNLKTGQAKNPAWTQQASTLAEFGTQQLEFVGLSHATGDSKYAQQAEYVIKVPRRCTSRPPALPSAFVRTSPRKHPCNVGSLRLMEIGMRTAA